MKEIPVEKNYPVQMPDDNPMNTSFYHRLDRTTFSSGHLFVAFNNRTQNWSYAIPLEIIYLTPLLTWNPHNLQDNASLVNGGSLSLEGRTRQVYRTPHEFFYSGGIDISDTSVDRVKVIDPYGHHVLVQASGPRIPIPTLPHMGKVRTVYPIMPNPEEWDTVLQELDAVKAKIG